MLLEVKNLHVKYVSQIAGETTYVTALRSITFGVNEGEIVAIVGPKHSGKTTLMKAIIRALPENTIVKGEIVFRGENLLNLPYDEFRWYLGKKIAAVFSSGSYLHPGMNILEQLLEIIETHAKVSKEETIALVLKALKEVGLSKYDALKFPNELSEGMKRRVLIAMALILEPELVIADNPIVGLDNILAQQIINLFLKLKEKKKFSLILLLDDLRWAICADKIVILLGGTSLECAPTEELFQNPWHPFSKLLVYSAKNPLAFIPFSVSETGCPFSVSCPFALPQCFEELPEQVRIENREIRCHRDDVRDITIENFVKIIQSRIF